MSTGRLPHNAHCASKAHPSIHHHRPTADEVCSQAPATTLLRSFVRSLLPPGPHVVTPQISGTQHCAQPGCSFPALCFPSVSNLQDGGEAVKDDRKSNCHHKKASVITFRPRFRLEGNTRLIYRLDGTHSQRVEPPSTHSAFEARLNQSMQPSSSAVAAASQPAHQSFRYNAASPQISRQQTSYLPALLLLYHPGTYHGQG